MRVITTFAARHWTDGLARGMVGSFLKHWDGFDLHCYVNNGMEPGQVIPESLLDLEAEHPKRLYVFDHYRADLELAHFVRTYEPVIRPLIWYGDRYEYKWDATRFAHKVYALARAELQAASDLIWLDSDVISHADVTPDDILGLIGDPLADVAYLGREGFSPEVGFVWFNRARMGGDVIHSVHQFYENRSIFREPEWHDAFLFGKVIPHYYGSNISVGIKGKHVWPETPLARFCSHLKGPARKRARADLPDHVALAIPDQVTSEM